ncbi:hypothetical protein [Microcoleus sp. K4-B3]|uniref:hypothetical protein n=1 Tax=Microcoleus sp. K4-B3 TaxID=2818791 RepID=UPI002FD6D9BC
MAVVTNANPLSIDAFQKQINIFTRYEQNLEKYLLLIEKIHQIHHQGLTANKNALGKSPRAFLSR